MLDIHEVTDAAEAEALHVAAEPITNDQLRCSMDSLGPQPPIGALVRYIKSEFLAVVACYENNIPCEYTVCAKEGGEAFWLVLMTDIDFSFSERHLAVSRWCAEHYGDFFGEIENQEIRNCLVDNPGYSIDGTMVRLA